MSEEDSRNLSPKNGLQKLSDLSGEPKQCVRRTHLLDTNQKIIIRLLDSQLSIFREMRFLISVMLLCDTTTQSRHHPPLCL